MANSGQPDFLAGGEAGMDSQSCLNSSFSEMINDPLLEGCFGSLSESEIRELLQSPINMGTQFNSQQYVHTQPATQQAGTSSGVAHNQHLTNINVSRTGTPEMTPVKTVNLKKREADKKYRDSLKQKDAEMKGELDRLKVENALLTAENNRLKNDEALRNKKLQSQSERIKQLEKDLSNNEKLSAIKLGRLEDAIANLRKENESLKYDKALVNENMQSLAKTIDQQGRSLAQLKSNRELENLFAQRMAVLLKDKDLKFIKEEEKQDPFASDEERQSEKEFSAGNLDGGDSEDYNDSTRKKKRVARSAPSECRSGKVPKLACYDARADQRKGSTSNPTAMVIDSYTITDCLHILKAMGIPYPIVRKAKAKFESSDEREYFVGLTEDWRREWVKDLENDA